MSDPKLVKDFMIPLENYCNEVHVGGLGLWLEAFALNGPVEVSDIQVSAVPLPSAGLLLASGLIPLAWARRKKRLGK